MTHAVRFVAVVAVLIWGILAWFPLDQGPTPETDALRARAEAGDAEAQSNLGFRYEYGEGVPEDSEEAVRWYRRAANQGHADAQYSLGAMYGTGEGVPQDDAEATRLYRLAADQGHADAQWFLGLRYEMAPFPLDQADYVQAHMWYNLASRQPGMLSNLAVEGRDRVAGQMTPTQLAEAQRLAREREAAYPRDP